VGAQLTASQEGLSSMELVSYLSNTSHKCYRLWRQPARILEHTKRMEERKMNIQFELEKSRNVEDLGVDCRIILKRRL
jgi:hypothetical protein